MVIISEINGGGIDCIFTDASTIVKSGTQIYFINNSRADAKRFYLDTAISDNINNNIAKLLATYTEQTIEKHNFGFERGLYVYPNTFLMNIADWVTGRLDGTMFEPTI